MTSSLRNVAVRQFSDLFTQTYQQSKHMLAGTTLERRGVVGDAFVDKIIGEARMKPRLADSSFIPADNVSHNPITTVFKEWVAKYPTDIFAQSEVNADERSELVKLCVNAVNRQQDQTIIDGLNAASGTGVVPDNGSNLNVDKLRQAAAILDAQNVSGSDRYFIAHANQKQALLAETETTSSDYNTVQTLVRGDIDTFYGFKFMWFGNLEEGGIPLNGDIRTAFAWHKSAMRSVWAEVSRGNPGLIISFSEQTISDLVIPTLKMGAKDLLPKGIVKIDCDES